jgi:Tol biopolymer transport system component
MDPDATLPPSLDANATLAYDGPQQSPTDGRAPAGYVIEKELGRGGMGVVYLARSLALQRPCALKMILAGAHSGSAEVERFRTEAQAIARLQHPGIVQVFEVGEHDGRPFMALEYCGGGSLADKLRANPLPPKDAAVLVRKLVEAVQAAHEAKVIHRDLKPGNVLLTERGEPKITDFGLAKKLDEDGATRTGSVMGTPSYMPPEQAEGKKEVGPAADVYALGAILYECLAGRPPFKAATPLDTLLQVINQEPVSVRQMNGAVPRDLETIVHKCLQKDARKRYATAQELAEDLGRYLNGEPIRARPVGVVERAVKWVRRNRAVSAAGALVVLTLTAGVAVSSWFAHIATLEARKAEQEAKTARAAEDNAANEAKAARAAEDKALAEAARAEAEKVRAEENLRRAEWSAYAGKLASAQLAFQANNMAEARQHLDECQWDLRGWEYAHLRWQFDSSRLTLRGHTHLVTSVAFSPDGRRLFTGSADKTAKVWDAATGTEVLTLRGHTDPVTSVAFSPDGRRLLTGSEDKTAKVWDAQTGTEVLTLRGHTGFVLSVAFSPDGRRILTGSQDGTARIWHSAEGTGVLRLDPGILLIMGTVFSPDGRRLLVYGHGASVWDIGKGTELLPLNQPSGSLNTAAAFSPDGQQILIASNYPFDKGKPGEVWLFDAKTGAALWKLDGHTGMVTSLAFSPDGRRAFAWDAAGKVLARSVQDGKPTDASNPPAKPDRLKARSPDGRFLAKVERAGVTIVDLRQPPPKNEPWPLPELADRRKYHTEQARLAENEGRWFAVAFHLGRLLLDDPDNAELKQRREAALQKHHGGQP